MEETVPQLGFVHRDAADYDIYLMQLTSVAPHFGTFVNVPTTEPAVARLVGVTGIGLDMDQGHAVDGVSEGPLLPDFAVAPSRRQRPLRGMKSSPRRRD